MTRYYFRIYTEGDPDGFTVWVDATSESEAENRVEYEYRYATSIVLINSMKK